MEMITITEAARLAGCSDKTLRRAIDTAELTAQPRTHKNQPILIDLAALQLYLEGRGQHLPERDLSSKTTEPAQTTGTDTDLAARIAALEGKIGERSDLTLTAVAEKHNALAVLVKKLIHEKQGNEALMQRIGVLERRLQEMEEMRETERSLSGGSDYQALTLAAIIERLDKFETGFAEEMNDTSGIDAIDKQQTALERTLSTFQAWVEPFLKQHHTDLECYRQAIDALEKFEVWATGLLKQVSDQLGEEQRLTTWLKERVQRLGQEHATEKKRLDTLGREKSTFAISEELKEVKLRIDALENEKTVAEKVDGSYKLRILHLEEESMNTARARIEEMKDLVKRLEQLETDEAHDISDLTQSFEKMDNRVGLQFEKHKAAITDTVNKLNELIQSFGDFYKLMTSEIEEINVALSLLRASAPKSRKRTTKVTPAMLASQLSPEFTGVEPEVRTALLERAVDLGTMVAINDFCKLHGTRLDIVEAVIGNKMLTPVEVDGVFCLDPAGQTRFWQIFNGGPGWQNCPDCPHSAVGIGDKNE